MPFGLNFFVFGLACSTVALAALHREEQTLSEKVYETNRTPIQKRRGECVTLKAYHHFPIKKNKTFKWQKYAKELPGDFSNIEVQNEKIIIQRLTPSDSALYQGSIETEGGKEITRNWLTIKDCDIHEKRTPLTDKCTAACEAKCEEGWHYFYSSGQKEDTCFKYFSVPRTWEDANSFCQSKEAHLATINNDEENKFVGDLLKTGDGGWIGLNDKSQEANYIWNYKRDPRPTFSAWDKSNPRDEEPNNSNRGCNVENCVELKYTTKKWNDAVCNAHFGFVCQVYSKIAIPGWNCSSSSGKCYKYDPLQVAWDEARVHCMNMNATLFTISSLQENDYVASFKEIKSSVWTGLNDRAEAGTYVWNDIGVDEFSNKATFFNWDTGEPNDKLYDKLLPRCTGEDCVQIKKWNGSVTWADLGCRTALPYVCEKRKDMYISFAAWIAISMGAGLVIGIVAARGYIEYKSKRGKKEFKALISNATRPVES